MGFSLPQCPILERYCCGVAGLRLGAGLAALIGLSWAALYLLAYSASDSALSKLCVTGNLAVGFRIAHGMLGMFLGALHLVLLAGVMTGSAMVCEAYVWAMAWAWALVATTGVGTSAATAAARCTLPAALYFLYILVTLILSFYLSVVVANYMLTIE